SESIRLMPGGQVLVIWMVTSFSCACAAAALIATTLAMPASMLMRRFMGFLPFSPFALRIDTRTGSAREDDARQPGDDLGEDHAQTRADDDQNDERDHPAIDVPERDARR